MNTKLKYNIIKRKKKTLRPKEDPKKEEIIKKISDIFDENGYKVRREKLHQGFGWKAISGSCRVNDENLIFLDRKLGQDDQMIFLMLQIKEKDLGMPKDLLLEIPDKLKKIAKI
ncbi:MAG: hypothetical protein ACOX3T_07875 [Bdellovibrionota bacterium]